MREQSFFFSSSLNSIITSYSFIDSSLSSFHLCMTTVYSYAFIVCVCVCVRERERERESPRMYEPKGLVGTRSISFLKISPSSAHIPFHLLSSSFSSLSFFLSFVLSFFRSFFLFWVVENQERYSADQGLKCGERSGEIIFNSISSTE